jgi:hypothetical protein
MSASIWDPNFVSVEHRPQFAGQEGAVLQRLIFDSYLEHAQLKWLGRSIIPLHASHRVTYSGIHGASRVAVLLQMLH